MTTSSHIASKDLNSRIKTTPIAIIGMASIFPQAKNLTQYWDNILRKIECLTDVPPTRWNITDYYDPDPNAPDKTYTKKGGFIPDIDFNPMEFGLPPNILEVTDVSQLLSLVVAKEALDDAGYGEAKGFNRDKTGVVLGFVGMGSKLFTPLTSRLQYPIWEKVLRNSGVSEDDTHKIIEKIKAAYVGWEENAFPGTIGNVIAGRIANRFDLGGINCVIDAACASSLAAVRMAVAELIEERADMMICGGVDTDNSIVTYMCFSKTPAFSKSGQVRTFDADADGMMVGEGIGMVILKRLEDAERDHDRIYAVIKSVAASSDGRFKSIYAPRPTGQAKAMRRAYSEAGFDPKTVGLIEAHGTGTMAGDPAEFQGLMEVFGENNPDRNKIALGSVKSQIAHTKAAAGTASLIKTAMALYHKVLPATINVSKPNPKFDIENTPFYINTETRPWIRSNPDIPRRAGVSAFGFGGTNFHVVLEEYENDHLQAYRLQTVPQSILLSAPDHAKLVVLCTEELKKISSCGIHAAQSDIYYNELVQRFRCSETPTMHARIGFVADSQEEARSLLKLCVDTLKEKPESDAWEHPKGVFYRRNGVDSNKKVVVLFPGQGSQYVDMGRELAVDFPQIREVFSNIDQLFLRDGLKPLSNVVYPVPVFDPSQKDLQTEILQRTEHAQPAIGSLSVGLYKLLQQAGIKPEFVAGHSFGELTSLWASGVISEMDFYKLAKARGKAMAAPDDASFDAGTMIAVKGDVEKIRLEIQSFPDITLANWNANNQVSLAGSKPAIAAVETVLKDKGFTVIPLKVSAAFHTSLVKHAQKPFAKVVNTIQFNNPVINVFSNTTGKSHPVDGEAIKKNLSEHILKPVLFKNEIETIYEAGGYFYIECGPKNTLTNFVDNILEGKPHLAVALNPSAKKDSDRQLREAIIRLRVAGLALNSFDPYSVPRKVAPAKKSWVSITLNAGLVMGDKRAKAFDVALNDGFRIGQSMPPKIETNPVEPPPVQTELISTAHQSLSNNGAGMASLLEQAITQFSAHQNETIRLHEQFLQNEVEYGRIFLDLTKMEGSLVTNAGTAPDNLKTMAAILENMERSLTRFHDHQDETLRIHEVYLKTQAEATQNYITLLQQQVSGKSFASDQLITKSIMPRVSESPVKVSQNAKAEVMPVIQEPPAFSATVDKKNGKDAGKQTIQSSVDLSQISKIFLDVVSEKTGYPKEMLELDMDMEADLGIDSIKRVEILGAMRTHFPDLPKVAPEVFAELRTLKQVIEHIKISLPSKASTDIRNAQTAKITDQTVTDLVKPTSNELHSEVQDIAKFTTAEQKTGQELNPEVLGKTFLAVVSEKTGYPAEMFELSMDMEADLGIDSIKRVEILGAVRAKFPGLPKVEPEVFAELRTLGQVIAHLEKASLSLKSHTQYENTPEESIAHPHIQRSIIKNKVLPPPDCMEMSFSNGSVALLTDDGTETTKYLAEELSQRGLKPVVLRFPTLFVPSKNGLSENVPVVSLADMSEETLKDALSEVENKFGTVAVFIHLDPPNTKGKNNELNYSNTEKAIVKYVFLMAKHLKNQLTAAAEKGMAAFITVCHLDGEFGLSGLTSFEPTSGGLSGLVKTLNQEWEPIYCRAVDISPVIDPAGAAQRIMAELCDPNRLITEVGYGPNGRTTLVVETVM